MSAPRGGRGRSGRQSPRSLEQFLDGTELSGTWRRTGWSGRKEGGGQEDQGGCGQGDGDFGTDILDVEVGVDGI